MKGKHWGWGLWLMGACLGLWSCQAPRTTPPTPGPPLSCLHGQLRPQLAVEDLRAAMRFYSESLGARATSTEADGAVVMVLGDSRFTLTDKDPHLTPPKTLGGTSVGLLLYTDDVQFLVDRAVKVGATVRTAPQRAWWGDHYAQIITPQGHRWGIATRVEAPSAQVLAKRAAAVLQNQPWQHIKAPPATAAIPPGYPALIPVIVADDARQQTEHYRTDWPATAALTIPGPDGTLIHQDLRAAQAIVMVDQRAKGFYPQPPSALGGTSVGLQWCDARLDMDWRRDPFGHMWRGKPAGAP